METMVPQIEATAFLRFLETGRTSPALFFHEGEEHLSGEYVVKLRGGMERSGGALCELYASLLAAEFGLRAPDPAILFISRDLADLAASTMTNTVQAVKLQNSVGWNFASAYLTNLAIWPVGRKVPPGMREDAVSIFAFDAMIQNPDRRTNNPNLGSRGNELVIFDHEMAFSFLLEIFAPREPWKLGDQVYIEEHVFARLLKHERLPGFFTERLSRLTAPYLAAIAAQLPEEWKGTDLTRIETHLRLLQEHAAEFAHEVERKLA